MHPLFGDERQNGSRSRPESFWPTRVLGFVGSAIICWIVLRMLAPSVSAWDLDWINNTWVKVGITGVVAFAGAILLSRIEGTIWGKYYVIIGYLFSLGLIIWIVLRLLNYV